MIYLIGGAPRAGKTILSKKLSEELNIPYISTDHIRLVIMPYFKGDKMKTAFPFESMFDLNGIDEFFKNCTGQEMLDADLIEAHTLWPGIKDFIDHMLFSSTDYIFEGNHLLPKFLEEYKENENVKVIYLIKEDKNKIFQGMQENKDNNDWIASNIKSNKVLANAAKSLCSYGEYFKQEAKKYGFESINTEDNFFEKIKEAVNKLK